jgi:hypothetical protein
VVRRMGTIVSRVKWRGRQRREDSFRWWWATGAREVTRQGGLGWVGMVMMPGSYGVGGTKGWWWQQVVTSWWPGPCDALEATRTGMAEFGRPSLEFVDVEIFVRYGCNFGIVGTKNSFNLCV